MQLTPVPTPEATPEAGTGDVDPTPTPVIIEVARNIDTQVARSNDDAHHIPAGKPGYSHTKGVVFAGAPGQSGPAWGGWRWSDLGIPANATITNAYVELNQVKTGKVVTTTLSFQDSAAPDSFSKATSPFQRWDNRTNFELDWTWNRQRDGAWSQTPSLVAGIQELVDSHGGIDALVLLEDGTGVPQRFAHKWASVDRDSARAARLVIEYVITYEVIPVDQESSTDPVTDPTGGTGTGFGDEPTITLAPVAQRVQVGTSGDDAYHTPEGWPGYSDNKSVVLAGARGDNGSQWGGWRWTGLKIPAGAIVTEAWVELNQVAWGFDMTTTLAFQDAAHPATFAADASPYHRWADRTTFELDWTWGKDTPETWVRTPSLVSGIQELLDTHGPLGEIVLLEDGSGVEQGRYHEWAAWDADPARAAVLYVEYTFDSATETNIDLAPVGAPPVITNSAPQVMDFDDDIE